MYIVYMEKVNSSLPSLRTPLRGHRASVAFSFLFPQGESSVLVDLGLETLFDFSLLLHLLPYRTDLSLESLLCSYDLALEIETATLLRIVGVKQSLVTGENLLDIGLSTSRGLDVENLACLIESHARGERGTSGCVAGLGLRSLVR